MLFDFGKNWKSAFAMVTLCTKNNNSLTLQRESDKMQDEMNDTESENVKLQSTLSQLRSTLDFLTNSDSNSSISPTEEIIFRNILHKKEKQSLDNLIMA